MPTYLDRFPPQDEETFRSLCQKPRELVYEDMFDLIGLFYPYADSYGVHGGLNQDFFVFIAGDGEWVEEDFG